MSESTGGVGGTMIGGGGIAPGTTWTGGGTNEISSILLPMPM